MALLRQGSSPVRAARQHRCLCPPTFVVCSRPSTLASWLATARSPARRSNAKQGLPGPQSTTCNRVPAPLLLLLASPLTLLPSPPSTLLPLPAAAASALLPWLPPAVLLLLLPLPLGGSHTKASATSGAPHSCAAAALASVSVATTTKRCCRCSRPAAAAVVLELRAAAGEPPTEADAGRGERVTRGGVWAGAAGCSSCQPAPATAGSSGPCAGCPAASMNA